MPAEQGGPNQGLDVIGKINEFQGAESVEWSHPDAMMDGAVERIFDTANRESKKVGEHFRMGIDGAIKGNDPDRVAESFPNGVVLVGGEVTLPPGVTIDYEKIIRDAVRDRGYTDPTIGFSADTFTFLSKITRQSSDINHGVTKGKEKLGAGDQGITIGAAIAGDGPEYMPLAVSLANALTGRLTEVKLNKIIQGLNPDGKSQVTLRYHKGKFESVNSVTIASAHEPALSLPDARKAIMQEVIGPVFDRFKIKLAPETQIIVNGAGPWHKYGPSADAGEIGRKLAIAFLSGLYPLGGGTPFGKDLSKVDRTGALIARLAARFAVECGLADKAEVALYWTIGQMIPDAININTFGTEHYPLPEIYHHLERNIAFTVSGAIEQMDLWNVIYEPYTAGGIFGRPEAPWEKVPSL